MSSYPRSIAAPSGGTDREPILAQLAKIVESPAFVKSRRRCDVLSYVVQFALENPGAEISERMIAAGVYGRNGDFDPSLNAVVRVEVSRLRAGLENYYAQAGDGAAVLIAIPKGSYTPVFWGGVKQPEAAPLPSGPHGFTLNVRYLVAAVLLFALLAGGTWVLLRRRSVEPELTRVTSMPGQQDFASASPDGSNVVFAWDERSPGKSKIFVKSLHGDQMRRLTSGTESDTNPVWSPDGRCIAFLRSIPMAQGVYVVDAAGGHERLLTTITTVVTGIAWTPDSLNLIVPDGDHQPLALFLVALATGARRQLTEHGSFFHPSISPDGRSLAFVTDSIPGHLEALCLLPLGPGYAPAGPVRILRETQEKTVRRPSWARDGNSLIYSRQRAEGWSLTRYNVASGSVESVAGTGAGAHGGSELAGGRILFSRVRQLVFIATVPTNGPKGPVNATPLFQSLDQDFAAMPSPDGKKIAFSSNRGGHRGFWIASRNGTGAIEVRLPAGVIANLPAWAPDSSAVYVGGSSDGNWSRKVGILRVSLTGKPLRAETMELAGMDAQGPSVSRDGRWLYFVAQQSNVSQIWRGPLPEGKPELISPVGQSSFSLPSESADGQALFYSSEQGIRRLQWTVRKDELYLPLPERCNLLRSTSNGIYYDTISSLRENVVYFQPFARGEPRREIAIGPHQTWAPLPGEDALMVVVRRTESNIELYTPR